MKQQNQSWKMKYDVRTQLATFLQPHPRLGIWLTQSHALPLVNLQEFALLAFYVMCH
jgi:hypothetical protein